MLKKILSIVMLAVLSALTAQVSAQNKKEADYKVLENVKEPDIAREIDFATSSVAFGYKNNSAIALVQAAQIFAKYPSSSLAIYDENGKPIETGSSTYSYDPKDLLKDAKFMAKDEPELLAYIDKSEKHINTQTKGETQASFSTASFSLGGGRTKEISFDVNAGLCRASVTSNSNYSELKLSAYTWLGQKDDVDRGTRPEIWFLMGVSPRVTVVVENLENYSTNVTVELVQIVDPDIIEKFKK